jgi:hypothetical protein
MFYEAVSNNMHSIGMATSVDGIKWTRYNKPVLERSADTTAWDGGGVGSPHVVWMRDTRRWRMYYIGNPAKDSGEQAGSDSIMTGLGVAESTDELGTAFERIEI